MILKKLNAKILPTKLDKKIVKKVFLNSRISSWWNPEKTDIIRNPLLAFKDMYIRERKDIVYFLKNKISEISDILEVGCGSGRITFSIIREFRVLGHYLNYVSVDISSEMLRIVNEAKHKNKHIASVLDLVQQDAEMISMRKESFDCILCIQVAVHLPDVFKFLIRASEIIKHGGYLLIDITVDNVLQYLYYFRSFSGILAGITSVIRYLLFMLFRVPVAAPFKVFNESEFDNLIRKIGSFKIVKKLKYGGPFGTVFVLYILKRI